MSLLLDGLPALGATPRERSSRLLFDFDAADLTVAARSGQAPTFTRASSGEYADALGVAGVAAHSEPAITMVDVGGAVRRPGLILNRAGSFGAVARARLTYPLLWQPQDVTIYLRLLKPAWAGVVLGDVGYRGLCSLSGEDVLLYDVLGAGRLAAFAEAAGSTTIVDTTWPVGGVGVVDFAVQLRDVRTGVQLRYEGMDGVVLTSGTAGALTAWSQGGSAVIALGSSVPIVGYEGDVVLFAARIAAGARSLREMRGLA